MPLPKIQHPVFSVEVPSTKKQVKFRPFTAREEKILLIAKQSGEESDIIYSIKQIVNNCITTDGFDVDKITIFDLEYLFLAIRIKSVSDICETSYLDHGDNKTYNFNIDLKDVKVVWPVEKPPTISIAEGMSMTMKWPTADLYTDSQLLEADGPDAIERLIVKCISKIYAGDETFDPAMYTTEEVLDFLQDVESKAYEEMRKFFDDMPHLLYVIEYVNSEGKQRRIELTALTDFFQFR